ncbi:MAG: AMP-binding protein, partial [Planctomycetes bacterium]|nr:AMP-binding protein [Planctomycetota bacterium]
ITGLAGVPMLWSLLIRNRSFVQENFPGLRYITNTGGAMPQHVLSHLRASLPTTKIYLMYGLTEAFRSTYLPPEELDRRPMSMGKAIPNTEIILVNDQGRRCGPGEVGELVHYGPTAALGYWGRADLTAERYRPHPFLPEGLRDRERVVYSGDLVRMDEEGFFYFVGRRDNLIKSAGFRISPTDVEEALCGSGMIHAAAVIGEPDELLGQRIKAFVTPKAGAAFDAGELLAHCAAELPPHMVPKSIETLDELPKSPNGKVDYGALRRGAASVLS